MYISKTKYQISSVVSSFSSAAVISHDRCCSSVGGDAVHYGNGAGLLVAVRCDHRQLYVHIAQNPQDALPQTHPERETHSGDRRHLRTVLAAVPHHKRGAGVCYASNA